MTSGGYGLFQTRNSNREFFTFRYEGHRIRFVENGYFICDCPDKTGMCDHVVNSIQEEYEVDSLWGMFAENPVPQVQYNLNVPVFASPAPLWVHCLVEPLRLNSSEINAADVTIANPPLPRTNVELCMISPGDGVLVIRNSIIEMYRGTINPGVQPPMECKNSGHSFAAQQHFEMMMETKASGFREQIYIAYTGVCTACAMEADPLNDPDLIPDPGRNW